MQSNIDVTNRDLVSLLSVIFIVRQFSINITVQQFFLREDTEEGAFNYAIFKVCRHSIYIYELVANLAAGQEELDYFHGHRIGFSNF